ncbi:hypothetical protein LX64_03395 [Chitinophaga skermanii]|uniref:Uncharacterized protein n=2 Tax=Chitinophaga skermanii TaxID=331697 RepID=A0A327QGD9_9BACT|nr:hypothetical protein LX64_03395 [Chitinophaga skermanii]
MRYLLLACCLLFVAPTFAQATKEGDTIPLPAAISSNFYEYSGLAKYNNELLLLPQFKKCTGSDSLYSISLEDVRKYRTEKTPVTAYKSYSLTNLGEIYNKLSAEWEGFEAIAVNGNQVWLTVETHDGNPNCYVLTGIIDGNKIVLDPQNVLALKRPYDCDNMGFECLTYFDKHLLALYEDNASLVQPYGYWIDPVNNQTSKINMPRLYFRITDICADKEYIYGINYYFGGKDDYKCYAAGKEKAIREAIPNLPERLEGNDITFARIVRCHLGDGNGEWEEVMRIRSTKTNWEGMVQYDKGFLLISDANNFNPKILVTQLVYFE